MSKNTPASSPGEITPGASGSPRCAAVLYLNGSFVPRDSGQIDIEDRGLMFGDGVYEVVHYFNGRPFAMAEHVRRLAESAAGIELALPPAALDLDEASDELVRRNGLTDAVVYWQVTRGSAPRSHLIPSDIQPVVFALAYPASSLAVSSDVASVSAILADDDRWAHCWIKSTMLLPNVLARTRAYQQGAGEAILHRDGNVTEGTSTAILFVKDGEIRTHPANGRILASVTRAVVLELAKAANLTVREAPVSVDDLGDLDEAMLCSTTRNIVAITAIDGHPVGDGQPGPVTCLLHDAIVQYIADACGC